LTDLETLRRNLDRVRGRIAAAAARAGRDPGDVTLVAVTKTVDVETIRALAALGVTDFGENRPRDLAAKRAEFEAGADPRQPRPVWHMIGHVQRNKLRRTAPAMDVVHSVDGEALAGALSDEGDRTERRIPAYVQVNVSGEATKGGFSPEALADVLPRLSVLPGLSVQGLMTMAPWDDDPERARPCFRRLKELRDWALRSGYLLGAGLSMGMSEDFDVAVEEGATCVRVGRAIVGART